MRLLVVALWCVGAARGEGVEALVRAVRAALAAGRGDAEIADIVARTRVDERVENAVIEQLEFEGAGARTVEELEWLREATSSLAAPAGLRLGDGAAPAADEQGRMIERARGVALEYSANLPNFLCTETVRRHGQDNGKPWQLRDTLMIDVAYSEAGERYKPLAIDGVATRKSIKALGGFLSNGEFGSLLKFIYRPESAARFQWERWGDLRGKRVAVFAFHIERKNSDYTVAAHQSFFRRASIVTGVVGLVYIDPETGRTMRFSDADDGLPPAFPVRETWATLDYDYADVAGQKYLLPRRIDMRAVFRESRVRNVIEFGNYRKFSSETTVSYEKQ